MGAGAGDRSVRRDDGETRYDDIVVLGGDAALCEQVFGRLADGGVFNLVLDQPLERPVAVDIGRMHYDHLSVIGTVTPIRLLICLPPINPYARN